MRKILIFLGVILIGLTLSGCNGNDTITIPQYAGVTIDGASPEVAGELTTFYTAKNAVVSVEIAVTNPSNVEISSVVINGYKYFSSRFSSDSTNKLVKFELNTGNKLGETIYSVDEVIYDDGPLSKSVQVSTNNTFKIYNFKSTPIVTRETPIISNESIQIPFVINDIDNVIVASSLVAILYSEGVEPVEVPLQTGKSTATFTGLSSNRPYEVKVRASFNLDDSNGLQSNVVLYSATLLTSANATPIATVNNAFVSTNGVAFDVTYVDNKNITVPGSIEIRLYKNGVEDDFEMIPILGSVTGYYFSDLLSNQKYEIRVVSDFDLEDGNGVLQNFVLYSYSFTTSSSTVPTPEIINLKIEENRVSFDVSINDPLGVIEPNSLVANLYVNGVLLRSVNIEEYKVDFQLYNLVSGFSFTIKIFADYDLNDGSAIRENQLLYSNNYETNRKAAPSVTVANIDANQGNILLSGVSVSDPNSTIQSLLQATLYENDVAVKTIQFDATKNELSFDYPIQYQQVYSVKIFGSYNLFDGTGLKSDVLFYKNLLVSQNPKAPVVEFNNIFINSTFIELEAVLLDADNTIIGSTVLVSLYEAGVLVDSVVLEVGTKNISFENLTPNTDYAIIATADYDVNDSSGVILEANLNSKLISTLLLAIPAKQDPIAEISNVTGTTTSIIFDALVIDSDEAILGNLKAVLYINGEATSFETPLYVGNNARTKFINLPLGSEYEIKVVADYSYGDGTPQFIAAELTSIEAGTIPLVIIDEIVENDESITFKTTINTDLGLSDSDVLYLQIYDQSNNLVGSVRTITSGTSISVFNLWSDSDYKIIVTGTYMDGEVLIEGQVGSHTFHTAPKVLQTLKITNLAITSNTITFDVNDIELPDPSGVIVGSVYARLYRDGILSQTKVLVTGSNALTFNANISDGSSYVIQIEGTINYNDSYGNIINYIFDSASFIDSTKIPN